MKNGQIQKLALYLALLLLGSSNHLLAQQDSSKNIFNSNNSIYTNPTQLLYEPIDSIKNKQALKIQATPVYLLWTNSNKIPVGINNSALIPNVGTQFLASAGVQMNWKNKWVAQIAPQFQYAQNKAFPTYPTNSVEWEWYYYYLNHADLPERMGNQPLQKLYPGQSFLKYQTKNWTAGISTENKWWGPAVFNPLVLSNNAPGFLHFTMSTRKPIETKIGSFQGEIIGGWLESSGYLPPETNRLSTLYARYLYEPKKEATRYITGLTYSYQPKWAPGLYVGLTKLSIMYQNEISNILDVLPMEGFFGNKLTPMETSGRKNSMGSWFARYIMPKEKAEIYYEYGRTGESMHIVNIFQRSPYERGFTAGLKKQYDLKNNRGEILVGLEITTLSLPEADMVNSQPKSWYLGQYVRQGFTNQGKVLGAGIGPGSNSQTVYVQWMKKSNWFGLSFNRTIHNQDFYNSTHYYLTDHFNQYWVSVATTAYFNVVYKKIALSGEYTVLRDLNRNWEWVRYTDIGFNNIGKDLLNNSGKLMIRYRL
jgi:hypothetical protein